MPETKVAEISHRVNENVVFAVEKSGPRVLVQRLDIILRRRGGRAALVRAYARVVGARVDALDVEHRSTCRLRRRLRRNDMSLNEVIRSRIRPEVVMCLRLRVLEGARTDQERAQNTAVVRVGDQSVLVVVAIGVRHQVINYAGQLLLVESDSDPQIPSVVFDN